MCMVGTELPIFSGTILFKVLKEAVRPKQPCQGAPVSPPVVATLAAKYVPAYRQDSAARQSDTMAKAHHHGGKAK